MAIKMTPLFLFDSPRPWDEHKTLAQSKETTDRKHGLYDIPVYSSSNREWLADWDQQKKIADAVVATF